MRFSLLSMVALITVLAIEVFTLKTPTEIKYIIFNYVMYVLLILCTWGAFCLTNQFQFFCKGFATLAWASILYGVFVRNEGIFIDIGITPLAKLCAEMMEHPVPKNINRFDVNETSNPNLIFFKIWNVFVICNAGIVGGLMALQCRPVKFDVKSDGIRSSVSEAHHTSSKMTDQNS